MSTELIRVVSIALAFVALGMPSALAQDAQEQAKPEAAAPADPPNKGNEGAKEVLEQPTPIPDFKLPPLRTVPVRRGAPSFNVQMVDASLLPRDKEGIWVLDFAFKPVRLITTEIPGKGRRQVHYLYYRVVNHTGKPRVFVPQFTLVTDTGKRYEDTVLPQAVPIIEAREDPSIPLLGAVNIMGTVPPSTKEGIDDAVFGVAVWEGVDPKADRFNIYVRGLSDGYQLLPSPDGGKPTVRHKSLRIDFVRRGDDRNLSEREIQLLEPPYEWIYW
ncbi:hypothetical protein V5E97_20325 [Singulisphaera sp. Ch08]|uniref:Uncharacterized protein n=1 Tax=Singulisphaera sp. Ch08 TaxID=3120278 RepID=A0AAU7C6E5_9BACT